MTFRSLPLLFAALVALAIGPAYAQKSGPFQPPANFSGAINAVSLPDAPAGLEWKRLEAINMAVLVPLGWKRHEKRGPYQRVASFSDEPLDRDGRFERGLTIRLFWHPQAAAGNEALAVDSLLGSLASGITADERNNKVINATLESQHGKRVMIIRYRNAPEGQMPIIVHCMHIGDPRTGLVHQIILESPEPTWDDNWKLGEQISRRIQLVAE